MKGASTNYYQVAMACAGYREVLGWGIDGECDKIKNKLLNIMQEASDEGWMDEQPPYGRFDRYTLLIPAELIDTLNSIGKELPEFALKNLKDSADLALARHNPRGDGVQYGRSLSVHGDCAFLEVLSTALRVGLIDEDMKPLALSFSGAILKKSPHKVRQSTSLCERISADGKRHFPSKSSFSPSLIRTVRLRDARIFSTIVFP